MIDTPQLPPFLMAQITPQQSGYNVAAKGSSELADLLGKQLLNTVVVRHDEKGNSVLQVQNKGNVEIIVESKIPFPKGGNIVLKVLSDPTGNQAQIISINGQPPAPSQDTSNEYNVVKILTNIFQPKNTAPSVQHANQTSDATIVKVSNGIFVKAVVLDPSVESVKFVPKPIVQPATPTVQGYPASSPNPVPLKTSDVVQLHIIASNFPKQDTAPSRILTPELNVSTRSDIKPTVLPVTQNLQFTGTVIGTEESGEVVLKTPAGTFVLPSNISLPKGTTLTLEMIAVSKPVEIASEIQKDVAKTILSQKAPIEELVSTLRVFDAELGGSLVQKIIPQAHDTQMAAKLLWFMVNVGKGDAGNWIGKDVHKTLDQYDQKDLLMKLHKGFESLKTFFSEPNSSGWHSSLFPVFDGEELQFGRFYVRSDEENNSSTEENDSKNIRFVVEVDLDVLGEIQLDGFVKTMKKNKNLDLIVRTKEPLTNEIRHDITGIFSESLELTGIGGSLIFQVEHDFPVHPETDESHNSGAVVI